MFLPIFASIYGCYSISSTWKFISMLIDIVIHVDFLLFMYSDGINYRQACSLFLWKLNVVFYFDV